MVGDATPRINAQHLQEFVNQRVRIVGKVTELKGETATIDANGPITIHLTIDSHIKMGNAAEIIGKVKQDQSLQVMHAADFGERFDYEAANAVVNATLKYKEIFYEPGSGRSGGSAAPAIQSW